MSGAFGVAFLTEQQRCCRDHGYALRREGRALREDLVAEDLHQERVLHAELRVGVRDEGQALRAHVRAALADLTGRIRSIPNEMYEEVTRREPL